MHDGDIFESTYKSLKSEKENEIILTANVNTDGASIFQSSKKTLWSLLLMINELPPKLRCRMLLVAVVWFADKEQAFQIMNLYIKIFLEQMSNLITNGVTIITTTGNKIRFRLAPLCFPLDSVARPIIANQVQFNGYYGCSWCYIEGSYLISCMKYPFTKFKRAASKRTHFLYLQDAGDSEKSIKPVRGVKHLCTLVSLDYFDCIWGFSTEYMHNVLLGVVRQL